MLVLLPQLLWIDNEWTCRTVLRTASAGPVWTSRGHSEARRANPLRSIGNYMYHLLQQSITLHFALSVLMGFVWFSKWTAIISLNSINQLIFVTKKYCFLCGRKLIFKYLDDLQLQISVCESRNWSQTPRSASACFSSSPPDLN
jgi:hypothetical protein